MADRTAPASATPAAGHRAGRHGGRNTAERLDELGAGLLAVADAVDAATAAHLAHNSSVADELAGLRQDVAALAAEVADVKAGQAGTALVLSQAIPPLLEAVAIVRQAADDGVWRTLRARRRNRPE